MPWALVYNNYSEEFIDIYLIEQPVYITGFFFPMKMESVPGY